MNFESEWLAAIICKLRTTGKPISQWPAGIGVPLYFAIAPNALQTVMAKRLAHNAIVERIATKNVVLTIMAGMRIFKSGVSGFVANT